MSVQPEADSQARLRPLASWVADRELVWVLLLSLPLLFPTASRVLTFLSLVSLPLLWCCRWIARGRLTVRSPLDIPILGLMVMLPVSLLVSPYPNISLPKLAGLLLGIALYYALLNSDEATLVLPFVPLLSLAIVALGLVGADWFDFKIPLLSSLYRHLPRLIAGVPRTMRGGFHPNEVGGTLAMLLPLVAAYWLTGSIASPVPPSRLEKIARSHAFLGVTVGVLAITLILTQSRTAIAAAFVALLFLGACQSRLFRWLALGAIMILAVSFWSWGPAAVLERTLKIPGSYTWQGRPEIWRNAWQVLRDYPLTGIGLNAFTPVSRARYTYLLAPPTWDFVHAHNILLQVGVDFGLIGLGCFLALLFLFFGLGFRTFLAVSDRRTRWLIAGLLASMIAYLAFGSIDAITLGAKPALLFWLVLGLMAHQAQRAVALSAVWPRWALCTQVTASILFLLLIVAVLFYPPLSSVALANWGQVAINRSEYAQAVALLEAATQKDADNRLVRRALAEAYASGGRETEALSQWREAGTAARELADKGEASRREGKLGEAKRWIERALGLDPTLSDAWYYLGLLQQAENRRAEAAQSWEKALALAHFANSRVDALDVERALGILLVQQGKAEEAALLFRQVLSVEQQDIRTRFNLGQALSMMGDYASARQEFGEAIEQLEGDNDQLDETFRRAMRTELTRALTTNASRRGDLGEAQRWAKEAKALEPEHLYPYADLAELYIAKGLYDEAIQECKAFLQKRPDVSVIYYLLGQAQAGAGDYRLAIQAYEEAVRLKPGIAAYRYALARALAANQETARAEQEKAQAEKLGPDLSVRATSHERLLSD